MTDQLVSDVDDATLILLDEVDEQGEDTVMLVDEVEK
jgi:hypothetical protein